MLFRSLLHPGSEELFLFVPFFQSEENDFNLELIRKLRLLGGRSLGPSPRINIQTNLVSERIAIYADYIIALEKGEPIT